MSWEQHIASMKINGAADEACISGLDGNVWAKSDGFNATQQEISTMVKVAKGESIPDTEQVQLNNIPFMRLQSLVDHTGCKLMSKNKEGDKVMCVVGLSNNAIVFATKTGPTRNLAVEACEKEVKYLKDSGL